MSQSKVRELIKHFFIYGFGSIAQSAASFILLPIITHFLTPTDFGIYTLINLSAILASTVFYLGISSALPRSFFDYKTQIEQKKVLATGFLLTVCGSVIQLALILLSAVKLSEVLFSAPDYKTHLILMFLGTAISNINTFFQTYFRLLNKSILVTVLGILVSALSVLSTIILLKNGYGLVAPIYGYLLAQIIALVITLFLVRHEIVFEFMKHEISLLLHFGFPTVLISFAVMGVEWSDRLFINKYMSLADVGAYSLAYKIGSLINAFYIGPFCQIWSPLMMKYRNDSELKDFFTKAFSIYVDVGTFLIVFINAFLIDLVKLMVKNDEYYKSFPFVPYIMLGVLIYGTTNILSAGLLYERKVSSIAVIYLLVAVISLILNALFIPPFGFFGATFASVATYILIPLIIYFFAKKYFSFKMDINKTLFQLVSLFVLFGGIHSLELASIKIPFVMKMLIFGCYLIICGFFIKREYRAEILKLTAKIKSFSQ